MYLEVDFLSVCNRYLNMNKVLGLHGCNYNKNKEAEAGVLVYCDDESMVSAPSSMDARENMLV